MATKVVTPREVILAFIKTYRDEHPYGPSVRDIQKHLHRASTSGIARHLHILYKEGEIAWDHGVARSIRLVERKKP